MIDYERSIEDTSENASNMDDYIELPEKILIKRIYPSKDAMHVLYKDYIEHLRKIQKDKINKKNIQKYYDFFGPEFIMRLYNIKST